MLLIQENIIMLLVRLKYYFTGEYNYVTYTNKILFIGEYNYVTYTGEYNYVTCTIKILFYRRI